MTYLNLTGKLITIIILTGLLFITSCSKDEDPVVNPPVEDEKPIVETDTIIDFSVLTDNYANIASVDLYKQWGIHNVHDPIIRKFGSYYYSYSTDVAYGSGVRAGLQIRRSTNLVEWDYVGWAFNGIPAKGAAYIREKGATPNETLWAPSVIEHNGEYRLYYSLASNVGLVSCIGLATSTNPEKGWKEIDIVVGTDGKSTQTNGIDPSVVITPSGEHWMVYGSSWDGIYILQLNPETGLALNTGSRGKRIAHRGFSGGKMNGNIEGPEIIYNQEQKMYYLFIAYDWLSTKYNIRVGRSSNVDGPYYDMFGNDMYENNDNYPMIVAPYKFSNHAGWQGVSHCTVFEEDGQYYVAHQGRPANGMFFMNMHVRQLFWTKDGWPVASPERYAALNLETYTNKDISGEWEIINFGYTLVPGFDAEQVNPDLQKSTTVIFNQDGTIGESTADTWSFEHPWLKVTIGGETTETYVATSRDWENNIAKTITFTGTMTDGMPLWGKKIK